MRTDIVDPWCCAGSSVGADANELTRFEDSFVKDNIISHRKLSDSDEYLQKLYSRLRNLKKATSKKDLTTSLSAAKEDYIARFISSECTFETETDVELSSNPLIRHIAPHLQALTTSELEHLLKADVLQVNNESAQQVVNEKLPSNKSFNSEVENKVISNLS